MQSETWTGDQYQADMTALHTETAYVAQCGFWAIATGEFWLRYYIMSIQVFIYTSD